MPNIEQVPALVYQPLDPYYYLVDNVPLTNILARIDLVNSAVDIASDQLRDAIGNTGSLANLLGTSLNSDGTLKASAIDLAFHNIGYHTDGIGNDGNSYVRMLADERSKLSLISSEATNLSLLFDTSTTSVLMNSGTVEMQSSVGIVWNVLNGNKVSANLTFPTSSIHRHYYDQEPQFVGLEPDYIHYKVSSSVVSFIPGSLRVNVNGYLLSQDATVDVPLGLPPNSIMTPLQFTEQATSGTFFLSNAITSTDIIRIDFDILLYTGGGDSSPVITTGAQGPQGFQGFQGAFGGPQGPQGVAGSDGSQGVNGTDGVQGAQGVQGDQGPQGAFGGPQGFQGVPGSTGAQGPQGATGSQGASGEAGGGAVLEGLTSARPSPGSQGRLYKSTDGPMYGIDNGASWDLYYDGTGICIPPNMADFSLVGAPYYSYKSAGDASFVYFNRIVDGFSNEIGAYVTPLIPGVSWTLKMGFTPQIGSQDQVLCGPCLYESSTGKAVIYGSQFQSGGTGTPTLSGIQITLSSGSSSYGSGLGDISYPMQMMRYIAFSYTNEDSLVVTYTSCDGINWSYCGTISFSNFTTAPDSIGMFLAPFNVNTNGGGSIIGYCGMTVFHWEYTTS